MVAGYVARRETNREQKTDSDQRPSAWGRDDCRRQIKASDENGKVQVVYAKAAAKQILEPCLTVGWIPGDGTFEAPTLVGSGESFSSVTAADVKGDGKSDLIGDHVGDC